MRRDRLRVRPVERERPNPPAPTVVSGLAGAGLGHVRLQAVEGVDGVEALVGRDDQRNTTHDRTSLSVCMEAGYGHYALVTEPLPVGDDCTAALRGDTGRPRAYV